MDFSGYDNSELKARWREFVEPEALVDDFENEPELGEDWREKVYSAKEQIVEGGFAEDSECFLVKEGVCLSFQLFTAFFF